ncbi:hypothetical protein IKD82_01970 [Candidatus Saccharibacteria bacterium]|nr:hypothetical protein [Candidatus Saccharibacteria bacterium]
MKDLKSLRENSIRIQSTVIVCWPQYGEKEEAIDMSDIKSKFNGAFCVNNSTICYVIDHEVFVTPYTREAMHVIRDAGLVEKHFIVPFSNWDYPKNEETRWFCLRKAAIESYYLDCENDAIKWSKEHGIGELSEESMKRCFRIPRGGVPVKHPYYETIIYPICNEQCLDSVAVSRLGRFCSNNGRVVFVYRDGHTYVTKGYWILDELRHAGYKESDLFVPFSNGETIMDSELATLWKKLQK